MNSKAKNLVTGWMLFLLLSFSGCRLPSEVTPLFSTHEEVMVFDANGNLLRRSPALRGIPRDMEFLPDGSAVIAVDGVGLVKFNPTTAEFSNYFGPEYLQDVDYVAGKKIQGLSPTYMTLWYFDEAAHLLDDQGQEIGSVKIPKGCNDIELMDNGNLLLTEGSQNRIREISPEGETIWQSKIPLLNPYSAIHTRRDTFIISDFDNHRVLEMDRENRVLWMKGGLNHPRKMQVLSDGNILVADSDQRRVAVLQPTADQPVSLVTNLNRVDSLAASTDRSLLLVGIEAFFKPTPKEKVPEKITGRAQSILIWFAGAVPLVLIYILIHYFRIRWSERSREWMQLGNGIVEISAGPLFITAIVLCIAAAWLFNLEYLRSGWSAFGIGILFTVGSLCSSTVRDQAGIWNSQENGKEEGTGESPNTGQVIRSPIFILIGILLSWFVVVWTQSWANDWWPIILWGIAPIFCIFGFRKRAQETWIPSDGMWLFFIFAVALFFRLYRIHEIPYGLWLDETFSAWKALLGYETNSLPPFQTTPLVRPNEFEISNLYLVFLSLYMKTFGASFSFIKATSILPSLGIVLGVYCLGKWSFGRWTGRLGALLIAMNSWQVTFGRWGWLQQTYVCMALFALAFYLRSYRWKCPRSAAWIGWFLGIGLFTYIPIVLTIATLVLLFILSFFEAERAIHIKQMGIAFLLVLVVFAPLWVYYLHNPGVFTTRARVVGIFQEVCRAQSFQPVKENLIKYATEFHRPGEFNPRHNIPGQPVLDPITGGLFLLGLVLVCLRFYRPGERATLPAFFLAMAGGIFSAAIEAPNSFRIGLAGPILCLWSALPLATLWERYAGEDAPVNRRFSSGILIFLVFAGLAGFSYYRYFIQYPSPNTWDATMGAEQHLIYTHLKPEDIDSHRLFVHPQFTTATFNLYTFFLEVEKLGVKQAKVVNSRYTPVDLKAYNPLLLKGNNLIIMPPTYEELMKEKYPEVQITKLDNPFGTPIAVMGKVEVK